MGGIRSQGRKMGEEGGRGEGVNIKEKEEKQSRTLYFRAGRK